MLAIRCFLYKVDEEFIDHILLREGPLEPFFCKNLNDWEMDDIVHLFSRQ